MRSAVPSQRASDTPPGSWRCGARRGSGSRSSSRCSACRCSSASAGRTSRTTSPSIRSPSEVMAERRRLADAEEHAQRNGPFLEKPPLKFWMVAAPIYFGWLPANEFGERFVDALLGSLAFLYVFGIGRKLAGPVAGSRRRRSCCSHSTRCLQSRRTHQQHGVGHAAGLCGGVYHFLAWRSVNPDVKRHVFAMSLCFVLGFMTKFVAAIFLPVVLVLAAASTRQDLGRVCRDWLDVRAGRLAGGRPDRTVVRLPVRPRGARLSGEIFGKHVMKRFTAYLDPAHLHPWNYYFIEIWKQLGRAGATHDLLVGAVLLVWRSRARALDRRRRSSSCGSCSRSP